MNIIANTWLAEMLNLDKIYHYEEPCDIAVACVKKKLRNA